MPALHASIERWPIAGSFTISRGSRTEAVVVVVEVSDGTHRGRGECVPYPRYGETPESVVAEIESLDPTDLDRESLRTRLHPGAARNAVDCALWDLEAKRSGISVARSLGLSDLRPLETAYTLSLGDPTSMQAAAARAAERPLLKVKLGGDGDVERILAVRAGAPRSRLIVDANEGWSEANFGANSLACREAGVVLIEQPLPAGADDFLRGVDRPVPICADESLHVAADLEALAGKYDAVNIKLDKTGGLTEALDLFREARRRDFSIMVGCMVGTSLAMAPAVLLAQGADIVDLDGPLLLARDRDPGLLYEGAMVSPPGTSLWG
ncbi:L-alanine-DL-glutamate epimerase [Faunimonas pinastri]|uniref:Dipeptide epimerase n=1 Tax=Faunimonas pinastri TaxID=1855383 RepID=A0A1H9FC22_9HYPH|nr:N-acetyl-D-Glu racemase DgcA [Faunimonas pinastri]SEQ35470.1 L-alanine-DL-glutamate epimerase [Faunimonas pinastri]